MIDTSTWNPSETVSGKDSCKIDDDREPLVYKIRFQREGWWMLSKTEKKNLCIDIEVKDVTAWHSLMLL
jgi:hypothetical protein